MRIRERLQRFMVGRYGVDSLSRFLLFVAIAALVLSMIFRGYGSTICYVIGLLVLVYSYFRTFSRNHQKRYAEAQVFARLTGRFKRAWNNKKTHFRQRRTHSFFHCPQCRQDIRVPKGKGKISITCPKCHHEFVRRT